MKIQQKLNRAERNVDENFDIKEHNHALIEQVHGLEKLLRSQEKEILALEEVLVKAEKTIEEQHNLFLKCDHQLKTLLVKEQEESRSSQDLEEDEFVISKDQFTHIENQLLEYQKEIKALKEENQVLTGKSKEEALQAKSSGLELDDGTIVKLFRDTYKKITKS